MRWVFSIILSSSIILSRDELNCCGRKVGDIATSRNRGLFLVVVRLQCNYHSPARYDDLLTLVTTIDMILPSKSNTAIDFIVEIDFSLQRAARWRVLTSRVRFSDCQNQSLQIETAINAAWRCD